MMKRNIVAFLLWSTILCCGISMNVFGQEIPEIQSVSDDDVLEVSEGEGSVNPEDEENVNPEDEEDVNSEDRDHADGTDLSQAGKAEELSGKCGDNLLWTASYELTEEKYIVCLNIEGSGPMYDYDVSDEGRAPWGDLEFVDDLYLYNVEEKAYITFSDDVTYIGENAISTGVRVESLQLPQNLKKIGVHAFWYCGTLSLPGGLEEIGSYAFEGSRFTSSDLVIPDSVTTIGEGAFYDTNFVDEVTSRRLVLPQNLSVIPKYAFQNCGIEQCSIPQSVKRIEEGAFSESALGSEIVLPSGLEYLGARAFYFTHITGTLSIPNGIQVIEDETFTRTKISTVQIGSGVEDIGVLAFASCTSLKEVVIPEGVEAVGQGAFSNDENLRTAYWPSTAKVISLECFLGCKNLVDIYLPDTIKAIGESAFKGCKNLAFDEGLLKLPEHLSDIGRSAFLECESIDTVILPGGIEQFNGLCFSDSSVSLLIFLGDEPKQIIDYVELPENTIIYYPASAIFTIVDGKWQGYRAEVGGLPEHEIRFAVGDVEHYSVFATTTTNDYGVIKDMPLETPKKEGYEFGGWFTHPVLGKEINASTVFFHDTTLYARFFHKGEVRYQKDMINHRNSLHAYLSGDRKADFKKLGTVNLIHWMKKLDEEEIEKTENDNPGRDTGKCFGWAAFIVGCKRGYIDVKKYGVDYINQINFDTKEMRNDITTLFMGQKTPEYYNLAGDFSDKSMKERLQYLVECAKKAQNENPYVLVYKLRAGLNPFLYSPHAVVLDGIEEKKVNFVYEGKSYEYYYHLKLYDTNSLEGTPNKVYFEDGIEMMKFDLIGGAQNYYDPKGYDIYISQNFDYWTSPNASILDCEPMKSNMDKGVIESVFCDKDIIMWSDSMKSSLKKLKRPVVNYSSKEELYIRANGVATTFQNLVPTSETNLLTFGLAKGDDGDGMVDILIPDSQEDGIVLSGEAIRDGAIGLDGANVHVDLQSDSMQEIDTTKSLEQIDISGIDGGLNAAYLVETDDVIKEYKICAKDTKAGANASLLAAEGDLQATLSGKGTISVYEDERLLSEIKDTVAVKVDPDNNEILYDADGDGTFEGKADVVDEPSDPKDPEGPSGFLKDMEKVSEHEYVLHLATKQKYDLSELAKTPADGKEYKITYATSQDSKIATMSNKGIIAAKKEGTSGIALKKGSEEYRITVNVLNPVFEKPVGSKNFSMNTGETFEIPYVSKQLKATFELDAKSVAKGLATIDPANGKITALKKGSVKVSAVVGDGKNARRVTTTVKVYDPEISGKDQVMVGKSIKLSVKGGISKPPTVWSVKSGQEFAEIDNKAKLTAKAEGTVVIEAKNNGRICTKSITVVK